MGSMYLPLAMLVSDTLVILPLNLENEGSPFLPTFAFLSVMNGKISTEIDLSLQWVDTAKKRGRYLYIYR